MQSATAVAVEEIIESDDGFWESGTSGGIFSKRKLSYFNMS